MPIKTIPLSRLQDHLQATLNECADSGDTLVVELPDHRLVTIQPLAASDDDALTDDLLSNNPAFRALVERSKATPRRAFVPTADKD